MRLAYIVSLYERGARRPADCLGDFYDTPEEARAAGEEEVARVARIAPEDRWPTVDWAVRFTVRRIVVLTA